ncbi:hypothetical protein LEQ06_06615 [Paraclostridium sp. AKS46]|nr:hypothetical protein [Paraclostridium sp. AKS46]
MKKTNKKILKFITLIILLISTAICGSSLQELRFGDTYQYTKPSNLVSKSNSLYAKNFLKVICLIILHFKIFYII